MDLRKYINTQPDWPTPKVNFYDISPLLANHDAFTHALTEMQHGLMPRYWAGIESRGFIFAAAMAQRFGGGLIMIRKAGKLPPPTIKRTYQLEYGQDTLEMKTGTGTIVIVDDVLATGGTMQASLELCQEAGYDVAGATVLIDLVKLHVDNFTIQGNSVFSALKY